jgi:hypothetical protein
MKIYFILLFFSFLGLGANAQKNATWTIEFNKADSFVIIKSKIGKGWHIYSQFIDPYVGPIPTSFTFNQSENFKLLEGVQEPEPIVHYDEAFGAELMYFENEVEFKQKIILTSQTTLTVEVNYMMCNDTMCLPPTSEKLTVELTK